MPTWAPSSSPELFWLAFSSIRDYGDILVGTSRDQLWGAAVDPALVSAGKDPSYLDSGCPSSRSTRAIIARSG